MRKDGKDEKEETKEKKRRRIRCSLGEGRKKERCQTFLNMSTRNHHQMDCEKCFTGFFSELFARIFALIPS